MNEVETWSNLNNSRVVRISRSNGIDISARTIKVMSVQVANHFEYLVGSTNTEEQSKRFNKPS